jgi:tape measure domain-containing protein
MAVDGGQIEISIDARIDNFNRKMYQVDNDLNKLKRQSAIAIPVDTKQLHGLNDLIDKKIVHLGVLRKEASIPIKPLYDPTSLSAGINQVREFRRELGVLKNDLMAGGLFSGTIRHQVEISNTQGYGILAQEFNIVGRDLGKGLQDVVKEIASLKPSMLSKALGFAGSVATAPLRFAGSVAGNFAKNIFTGFTEDIGRTLSGEFARGGTELGAQKIKSAVTAFNREVVGQNQVYETFFSELLRSGSIGKGVEAAMPRSEIGKIKERLLKLQEIATSTSIKKQLSLINNDPELKQLLVKSQQSVASEKEGFSSLDKNQQRALVMDRFLSDAQPTHLFKNIALPFINEFKGLLTFIQGMQSYRTSVESQKYYNERKVGFPTLREGEDIVNVIGGAQFKGGQGGRSIAMSVEMLAPNKRFIPVENPETDTEKLKPKPVETWFTNKLKEFIPELSGDLADTAINLFRQATHALNPTGYSTAAAQSIANIKLAQEQGRQGSNLSYSLGGAELVRTDQTMKYMGINSVNSLAMAYPFANFTQNTSPNFKAVLAQQDAISAQLRLGAFVPNSQQKMINISDTSNVNMNNHHQKHLFKNIEFLDLFFRTINAEMPDMSPDNISSIVHAGDKLFEVIGATKQLESLLKTGEFDMSSPYHRFAPSVDQGDPVLKTTEVIAKFVEYEQAVKTLLGSSSPEIKALGSELSDLFGEVKNGLMQHFSANGANLPEGLDKNLSGYFKYQGDARYLNNYLSQLASGKVTREDAASKASLWEKETAPWFRQQGGNFGDYQQKLVEAFTYAAKVSAQYAQGGQSALDTLAMFEIDNFSQELNDFITKTIDTSKLPKEEMARIDDWNVPDAFKKIQSGILAYNALVKSLKGQIPDINEFQQIGRGMSGAIALVGKSLVYKTDLDPIGASKIGSRNEVDAYNTAQGRLSPLLAKYVQGEALVVEKIQGRSMKDILDRIVKPVKGLKAKRDELLESLASSNDEQIRSVTSKLKSTKDDIESTQGSLNNQSAEVERLKILFAGADDAQKEGIQVEIRAAKRKETDAKRRLSELRSNETRYTSELDSFGGEIESVKLLSDEIKVTEDQIKKEVSRFNKAANILYKQVGRLGAAYHEMGIAHNDLASGNVFFAPKGITGIDFGNASVAEKGKSLPAGIKQNDQMTTYQRAVIDKDYWGILNPLSAVMAINSGYKRPLPLPEKRTFDTSLLPDTTVEPLPLGTTTPTLLKQFVAIPNLPTRPLQPINLGQTPAKENNNPVEQTFVAPTNSQDNATQAVIKFNNDFLKWAYGRGNNPSNLNPHGTNEPGSQLVLAGRRPDDDIPPAGVMIPDPWDSGPGGAALKQAGKNALQSIQDMADVAGKVTQAVPVPAKLVAAAMAGKIAFNTMGIDAPIEHLVQSLFGHAGDVIVNAITDTVQNHTGMAIQDVNQSLHSILDSMAQFQDIEPATNAVEKVVNFFKAIGNAKSAATHATVEPLINAIDETLKNSSASIHDVVQAIVGTPIHQASMFAGDAANVAIDIAGGAAVGGLASGAIKKTQEPFVLQLTTESPEVKFQNLINSLKTNRKNINDQIKVINDILDVERISSIANYSKNFIAEKQSLGGLPDQALSSKGSLVSTNKILGGWKGQFDQFVDPKDILKKAHGMGVAIPDGILLALQERGHLPKDATIEMLREMITSSKDILKSKSPSLVFKQIGQDIVAGLDQGLEGFDGTLAEKQQLLETYVKSFIDLGYQFELPSPDKKDITPGERVRSLFEDISNGKDVKPKDILKFLPQLKLTEMEAHVGAGYERQKNLIHIPKATRIGDDKAIGGLIDDFTHELTHAFQFAFGKIKSPLNYISSLGIQGSTLIDTVPVEKGASGSTKDFNNNILLPRVEGNSYFGKIPLIGGLLNYVSGIKEYTKENQDKFSNASMSFEKEAYANGIAAKRKHLGLTDELPKYTPPPVFVTGRSMLDEIRAEMEMIKASAAAKAKKVEVLATVQPPEVGTRFTRSAVVEGQKLDLHAYVSKTMGWYLSDLMVNGDFKPPKDPAIRAALRKQLDLWMQELFSVVGSNTIRTSPIDARSERLWAGYGFKEMEGDEHYGKMERVGLNINKGLTAGITGSEDEPIAAIANTSKKLITTAMDVLGEKSPSKVFIKIGENLAIGYKIGIVDGIAKIQGIERLTLPVPQLEKDGWKNIEDYKEQLNKLPITKIQNKAGYDDKSNFKWLEARAVNLLGSRMAIPEYGEDVLTHYENKRQLGDEPTQLTQEELNILAGGAKEAQKAIVETVAESVKAEAKAVELPPPTVQRPTIPDPWAEPAKLKPVSIRQQQISAAEQIEAEKERIFLEAQAQQQRKNLRSSFIVSPNGVVTPPGAAWAIPPTSPEQFVPTRETALSGINFTGGNGQPPRNPPIPPAGASPNQPERPERLLANQYRNWQENRINGVERAIAQAPQNADRGFWTWFNNILDEIEAGAGAAGAGIRGLGRIMGALEEKMPGLGRILENIKGFAGGLLMYVGFQQIEQVLVDFARQGINTALQLERMKAALTYDSSINAGAKLKEIAQYADDIGANALVAAQSFTKLTVAAANTTVAPQVQKIFEGFSAALVGQGATPDEQQRAFLSVQQMIGKGEIMAEELRSQLAEVLPQAIGAMARSQGLTQEQLANQMKNSKMFPETDLQPLAKQLSYEATLPINTVKEGPLGSIARFQNAQEKLQGRLGETILGVGKPAMDLAAGGMNAMNSVATGLTATMGLLVTFLAGKFVFALLDTGTASRVVRIALKVLGLEFMTNNWILNGLNTGLAKLNTNLVISGSSSNVAVRGLAATAGALSGIGSALYAIAPQLIAFAAIGFAIDKGTKIWQSYHGELKKTNDELEQMINNLEATNTLTGKTKDPNKVDRNDPTYTRLGGSNPTPITGVGDFAQRVFGGVLNNYTHPFGFDPSAPNSGINNIVIDYRDEKGNIYKSVRMDKDDRRDLMEDLKQVDRGISYGKRLIEQADANYANPQNLAKDKADISQLDREIAVIRTRLANNSKLGGNNREEFKNLSAELAVKVGDREKAVNEAFGNQIALEQMNKVYEAMRETEKKNPDAQAREAKLEVIAKLMSDTNVRLEAIRMSTGSINQKIPGLQGASQLVSSAGANIAEYNQGLASRRNNQLLEARLNQKLDDIDLQRQQALDNLTTAKRELLPVKQDAETFKGFALNGLEPSVAQDAMNRLELRGRGGEKYKDPLDMIMNTSVETMKALVESGDGISGGLKTFLEQSIKFKEKYQQANELEGKVLQAQIDLEKLQQQRLNAIRQANTQIAASNTNIEMYQAASKGKIGTQDIQAFSAYNDLATAKSQLEDVKALFKDNSQDPVELAKQLASANEAVAKAKFAVMQSGQNTEEYYQGLGQSVEDFNRSVLETEIGWQQQIRDFGWSVQDSARNAFIETRGLQEAWADLQFDLEGQLLAAQNELKSTSEKLRQAKATLAVESISFQPDSIGKKTASIFVDFLSNIGNLEGEGRSLDEKQRQVGQEYVTTLRRIRDEQEKQLRAEEERTRSIIRLNEQFRSMMMQMESSSIKLGRELEQIITRITKEAPNSGYQNNLPSLPAAPLSYNPSAGINIDPRYGEPVVERVPFSVPMGQPSAVVQPTKYYAPGDVNGLNGLMGKYGGGMRLNLAAPKQVETSYQLQIPAQNILTAPARATTSKKMATADLINQIAKRLGANPRDLAALISFESAGSFNPDKMGGTGNNYQGWIQFSPDARKRYGVKQGQSIEQHAEATYRYLYDRLKRNGDLDDPSIKNLYKAINPGFDYGNLLYRLQKDGHWRNADRLTNLQSSIPKEWLVADASEGISDMGSAIFQTNATAAARAKRIEQEKARKRQAELNDPNNISRKPLEDIIKYQKELYPEAFKLDEFYESKGIKFIDRMSSKDWKKRTEAIAKQFKESQARVDAAKGIGSSNANVNPNIEKYQTLPGYQPSQLEPQVDMNGGNVLPNVQSPFITKYQPKAINDYSNLQQITDQNSVTVQDTSGLNATAGQINDVKQATLELNRALNSAQKNVELLKFDNTFKYQMQSIDDTARNLGRKIQDNGIKYQELMINSKGFKTALDEITLAGEGVSSQFRQIDREFYDELLGLGRQIGDIAESRLKITEVLAEKEAELTKNGRQATAEEKMALNVARESLNVYDKMTSVLFANYEAISKQREKAAALADTTKQATEAWLRLDKIMSSKQGYAKVQADLYKTRYDVGAQNDWGMGTLIDPSAIINARMQAAQARVDLEKQIRDGAYSPQQASEMRRFQAEISELNIKRSFVDAIPGLKEFSSGLRSAILESKGLGESLNKVKDLVLGMMLEQLAIKPFQNAIAEWVGPMLGLDNKEFYPQAITRLGERGASIAANNIVPFDLSNTLTTGQALPDTIDLSSAFTSLTESTTNTSQVMDNIFLAGITSTDPAMVGFIMGLTEATAALAAFAGALTVSGGGSFINAGSNIFGNLFNAGNASAGQSIVDSLSGGFTGMISHAFNFADGGPVDPLKIDNYAGGGLVEGISQAMNRERSQSGGKQPILAVLNADEYVISANEASDYRNYKDWSERMAKDVKNFAQGGPVSYIPNTTQTNTSEGTVNNFNQTIKIEVANTNDLGKSMSQIERDRQLSKLRAGVR